MKRRQFLRTALFSSAAVPAVALALADGGTHPTASRADDTAEPAASNLPRLVQPRVLEGEMLYTTLGKTGLKVSSIGFGGSHFGKKGLPEKEALRLLHQAIDRGVNYMDNCWDYNGGESETRMGKALSQGGYRQKVILMSKIDGRTKEAAQKQIDESLKRLKTDHVDLMMHHEILRFDDPDRIYEPDGAQVAMEESKRAGKIRFIGFTGHKHPHVHLNMLDVAKQHGVTVDAVLMPLNVMDAHFRSFGQQVLPRLVAEGVGVLSMKCFAGGDGILLKSNTVTPMECLHYALSLPTNVVITGIDKQLVLDQAFEAAKTFKPLDTAGLTAILEKTRDAAKDGKFELFKTSNHFDGTATHPDWLGKESARVQQLAPKNAG